MCVVEEAVGMSMTVDGLVKRQKRDMNGSGGTCDSSNCVYCQQNAQRFGEIVRQYYHHPVPTTSTCGSGSDCSGMKQEGPDSSSINASSSSIWQYQSTYPNLRLDLAVDEKVDSGNLRQCALVDVCTFSGCWQDGNYPNSDIVCGLEFEKNGCLFATAGVSKQVRVYSLAKMLEEQEHQNEPIRMHRLASKLSSLSWNPAKSGVVSVGDYDGVVTEIDLETGHIVNESDGHSGRRVWSVSHSVLKHGTMASASEDGDVALWDAHGNVVLRISPKNTSTEASKSPVTGVQMSPWDANIVGIASASSFGYLYDIRQHTTPVKVFRGHERPVSYVKFLDQNTLVTAGIDSSLVAWDVISGDKVQEYRGHCNNKHFVGLSVRPEDGLISCGSETGHVFCYDSSFGTAIATHLPDRFNHVESSNVFCSAIAWQPVPSSLSSKPLLASAFSDGSVDICALKN